MTAARYPFLNFEEINPVISNDSLKSINNIHQQLDDVEVQIKEIFYSEKELTDAKEIAYQAGELAGREQQRAIEQDFKGMMVEMLNNIVKKIDQTQALSDRESLMVDCAELAFAVGRKISAEVGQQLDKGYILNFIKENFKYFIDEATVTIKINSNCLNYLKDEINLILEQANFQGKLKFAEDEEMSVDSCEIKFQETTIKKTKQEINESIDNLYNKYLAKNDDMNNL